MLRVLGIDPGSQVTGFGVVESSGSSLVLVEGGCVTTKAGDAFERRLAVLHEGLCEVIARTAPTHAAVETLFFAKNVKSAVQLGHARGVALLAVAQAGLALHEYAPSEVKRAVTGAGGAEKGQVAHMVKILLGTSFAKLASARADATDACAIAICHANMWRTKSRVVG